MSLVTLNFPLIGNEALEQAIKALQIALNGAFPLSTITSISVGANNIVFDTARPSDYSIFASCLSDDGDIIGYEISNKTLSGFTITPKPSVSGTFEWFTVLKA